MAENAVVDAAFLVALLTPHDAYHGWAVLQASEHSRPWRTCEAALSETCYLLGERGVPRLTQLLRRRSVVPSFVLTDNLEPVLHLMDKYSDVPISFADACLVRMTEILSDPTILTTDSDFQIYRRHGRQTIPCVLPQRA